MRKLVDTHPRLTPWVSGVAASAFYTIFAAAIDSSLRDHVPQIIVVGIAVGFVSWWLIHRARR